MWNVQDNKFEMDLAKVVDGQDPSVCTKQSVLSITAKFFNPLGMISSVIVQCCARVTLDGMDN